MVSQAEDQQWAGQVLLTGISPAACKQQVSAAQEQCESIPLLLGGRGCALHQEQSPPAGTSACLPADRSSVLGKHRQCISFALPLSISSLNYLPNSASWMLVLAEGMKPTAGEVVLLLSSALLPLEEGVFQQECRPPYMGAPLLEAHLSACPGIAPAHTA